MDSSHDARASSQDLLTALIDSRRLELEVFDGVADSQLRMQRLGLRRALEGVRRPCSAARREPASSLPQSLERTSVALALEFSCAVVPSA
jgi:hypothetical protein